MNVENRLKLFEIERAKILGFGRSHLRSVELSRRLLTDVEKKVSKSKRDFSSLQAFHFWIWETTAQRCDELLRREHFQFRVFDEGAVEFLDQSFVKRPGGNIEEQIEQAREVVVCLPEKARVVLQLHYQHGQSCLNIAKQIRETVDEVYQLWQHSMIFLWEATHTTEQDGFQEKEDEEFWTLALHYLDGTASEKFVADLNSEIHLSKSRTKEYNDLRLVDGVMIEYGTSGFWPESELVDSKIATKKYTSNVESLSPKGLPALVKKGVAGAVASTTQLFRKNRVADKVESLAEEEDSEVVPAEAEVIGVEPIGALREEISPKEPGMSAELEVVEDQTPDTSESVEEPPKPEAPNPEPVLATENLDESTRHGVHFDNTPLLKKLVKLNPIWLKRAGIAGLILLGVCALAIVGQKISAKSPNEPEIAFPLIGPQPVGTILNSVGTDFSSLKTIAPRGDKLVTGDYKMNKGFMEIRTIDSVGVIIEAPARFSIRDGDTFVINEGRYVFYVSAKTPNGVRIETDRFIFFSSEGEIGVIADAVSTDLMMFAGEGAMSDSGRQIGPGQGLKFFELDDPIKVASRDEAHRYPEVLPVTGPKAYGDNMIVNHSFELGCLSRSCKTERLYRDIPLGWRAGWQKDGVWTNPMEQHSGTVRLTDAIGGLPAPNEGERYAWINHGFIAQEIRDLVPGTKYELSVKIASHRNLGPGAGHLVRHVGGNTFRFGVWTGNEWVAESSGQLKSGQPFQEMKIQFEFPEIGLPGMSPVVMLTGETRIFYDSIVLRKMDGSGS